METEKCRLRRAKPKERLQTHSHSEK